MSINKNILVFMLVSLMVSNTLFADNKADEKAEKKEISKKSESVSAKKLCEGLEKLIEARESVEEVYIQINKSEIDKSEKTSVTVLIQAKNDSKLNDEELNKINTLISAAVDKVDAKDITITEVDFDQLKKKFAKDIDKSKSKDKSDKKEKADKSDKKDKDKVKEDKKDKENDSIKEDKKDSKKEDTKEEKKD